MARKYENILARYRTYSYHHAFVVCSNTEVALELERSKDIGTFIDDSTVKYQPKTIKGKEFLGKYVILINGRSDSRFSITTLKLTSFITNVKSGEQASTATYSGEMVVKEPQNVGTFLNIIQQASDDLGVSFTGLVFMIKTFIVGHTNEGRTEWINIKPLFVYLTDIKANFDIAGATYDVSFISYTNGVSNLPFYKNIIEQIPSIKLTQKKSTLFDAILDLEIRLNSEYEKFYQKLVEDFSKQGKELSGRKIYYNIQLDPVYYSSDYIVDLLKDFNTDKINSGFYIPLNNISKVEDAIYEVMTKCSKVVNEGVYLSKTKPVYGFKVLTSVTSTEDEVRIIYKINRYQLPFADREKQKLVSVDDSDVVEFDYIYTGRNIYIRDFNLKMNMGLSFLQMITSSDQLPAKDKAFASNKPVTAGTGSQYGAEKKQVISVPTVEKRSTARNTKNTNDVISFQETLSRFAVLETIESNMTIMGDPYLYNDIIVTPYEDTLAPKYDVSESRFRSAMTNWQKITPLIKINIKKPKEPTREGQRAFEDFWYRGYYHIIKIDTTFEDGQFLQTLNLLAVPTEPVLQTTQNAEDVVNEQ